jgi:hypothetical protein
MQLISPENSISYELADIIQGHTDTEDLLVILDNQDPTTLYLTKRKGWHGVIEINFEKNLDLDQKAKLGAQYFAGDFISCQSISQITCDELRKFIHGYPIVFYNDKYFIVKLSH